MLQQKQEKNLLARKLTELKDFPLTYKLTTYGKGSFLGEEDVIRDRQQYSCSVKCVSEKGKLYQLDVQ